MKKGKAVYCEKPMVNRSREGWDVINAQKEAKKIIQVGSQRVSSLGYAKANELYKAGEIDAINSVEAVNTRHSFLVPGSTQSHWMSRRKTVDWKRYEAHDKRLSKVQFLASGRRHLVLPAMKAIVKIG